MEADRKHKIQNQQYQPQSVIQIKQLEHYLKMRGHEGNIDFERNIGVLILGKFSFDNPKNK